MATESIPAAFGVIQHIWDSINSAGILGDDYSGLIPIVPIEEETNLLEIINENDGIKTAPYIIYSYYNNGAQQNWWEEEDTLILVIHSLDQTKLRQLTRLITNLLKRWDESARAVNVFVQSSNLSDEYKAFEYKYIHVASATGGVAGNAENEPIQAAITINLCYTNTGNDVSLL